MNVFSWKEEIDYLSSIVSVYYVSCNVAIFSCLVYFQHLKETRSAFQGNLKGQETEWWYFILPKRYKIGVNPFREERSGNVTL